VAQRLTSRYIYVCRDMTRGHTWGATNMRTLSRKSGISYHRLRYWFNHRDKDEVEFDQYRITRLSTNMIFNKADIQ